MAKEKTGLTAKETTLNLIIEAQKDKIKALEDYGKKLKKELKQCKGSYDKDCEDLQESFQAELKSQHEMNQNILVMAVIGTLILGILIGVFI